MFNILVVDDDKNTRNLFSALLKNEGFNVQTAEDGEKALEFIDKAHVDLIVADIMMPGMDGYALTEVLRRCESNVPILMVSAKQLPEDRKKGFHAGIDDYMSKPVDDEEFILRVKALLRRSKIYSEKKLTIGEVTLDCDSLTVSRASDVQELPQKEFLLLFKLLSYPDKIFTRIQLMDEIWGMDCETGWETVTVHINRLRKRFESYPEFEIVSVRGLGYKAVKKL